MNKYFSIILTAVVFIISFDTIAFADAPETKIADIILNQYRVAALSWIPTIRSHAITLFWALALLDFTWMAINLALKNGNLYDLAFNTIRKILFLGFFFALLLFCWNPGGGPKWIDDIINSFVRLGGLVPGGAVGIGPGFILENTFDTYMRVMSSLSVFSATTWAMGLASIVLLLVGVFLAAVMLLVMVEMYVATSIGIFLLGFGGSEWTKDYAISYMKYIVSVGLKLMATQLVGALAVGLYRAWSVIPTLGMQEFIALLIGLILLAIIVAKIPEIIASLVSGGQIGTNPVSIIGGAASMGAAALTGGAAFAASSVAGTGKSMALLREAVKVSKSDGVVAAAKGLGSASLRTLADNMGKADGLKSPLVGGTYANMRGARQEKSAASSLKQAQPSGQTKKSPTNDLDNSE